MNVCWLQHGQKHEVSFNGNTNQMTHNFFLTPKQGWKCPSSVQNVSECKALHWDSLTQNFIIIL